MLNDKINRGRNGREWDEKKVVKDLLLLYTFHIFIYTFLLLLLRWQTTGTENIFKARKCGTQEVPNYTFIEVKTYIFMKDLAAGRVETRELNWEDHKKVNKFLLARSLKLKNPLITAFYELRMSIAHIV